MFAAVEVMYAVTTIYRSPLARFRHFLRCAVSALESDAERQARRVDPKSVEAARDVYVVGRVKDQIHHYQDEKHKANLKGPRCEYLALGFSIAATAVTFLLVLCAWNEMHTGSDVHHPPGLGTQLLGFAMIAFPSLASLFVSLVSINEWKRRVERYEEMIEFLREIEVRARHVCRRETLERLVVETELALLAENFEWYHLATKSAQT